MNWQQARNVVDDIGREQVERKPRPQTEERPDGVTQPETENLRLNARAPEELRLGGQSQMCRHARMCPFAVRLTR